MRGDPWAVRTIAAFQRFSRSVRIVAAQREWNRRRVPFPTRPRCCPMDTAGTVLAVAGGCRAVEAARDASAHPVHAAFVTVAHGRLEAPMDRIGCFVAMGLWPKRCVAGTARLDFAGVTRGRRGWPPAALSQDRCVALAGREPCSRSVVAAFGQARPRGRRGIGLGPVGVALAGSPRFTLARMSPRRRPPSPPVRFVSHGTCRVFTRRSRVRVPRFRRRCAASLV